ncbi:MAG: hypothetical protein OEZ22_09340 [Spirochaetia bacterium]|nr:hypothetical protein [Spirochaetia bacterium]
MEKLFHDNIIFYSSKEFASSEGKIMLNEKRQVRFFSEYIEFLIFEAENKGVEMNGQVKKSGFVSTFLSVLPVLLKNKKEFEDIDKQKLFIFLLTLLTAQGWGKFELEKYENQKNALIKVYHSFEAEYFEKKKGNTIFHCSFILGMLESLWILLHAKNYSEFEETKTAEIENYMSETPRVFEKTCSKEGAKYCTFEINERK